MSGLRVASLFSGIGLLDRGLNLAGIPTGLLCESDKACRRVLAHHHPDTPIHDDVRTLTGDDLRAAGLTPWRTVLAGGFPCQDLSIAGRRAGMGRGTRSGLYWQIVRLLGEFPARWVILENVPGLLSSHGGRDMGAVVGSLADLGYGYAWRVLDAQHFGVPQRRRRVVIVGHLGVPWSAPAEVLLEPESSSGHPAAVGGSGAGAAGRAAGGAGGRRVAAALTGHHGRNQSDGTANLVTHALSEGHDASEDGTGRGVPLVADTLTSGSSGARPAGRRREDDTNLVVVGTLDASDGGADDNDARNGRLVATYQRVVRSGGRDADGNLPPDVWAQRDIAATLSPFDLGSDSRAVVSRADGVRRLTPTECERLQGAPDGWTAVGGQKDSPRYRQLGNAVAVPVFRWVGQRLATTDARLEVAA